MAIHETQDIDMNDVDNVQSDQDNATIQKLLTKTTKSEDNRPLNLSEKANNVEDYKDFSDDDLLEEEGTS